MESVFYSNLKCQVVEFIVQTTILNYYKMVLYRYTSPFFFRTNSWFLTKQFFSSLEINFRELLIFYKVWFRLFKFIRFTVYSALPPPFGDCKWIILKYCSYLSSKGSFVFSFARFVPRPTLGKQNLCKENKVREGLPYLAQTLLAVDLMLIWPFTFKKLRNETILHYELNTITVSGSSLYFAYSQ